MFYQSKKEHSRIINRRNFILLTGKVVLFSIVGLRLFNLQITQSNKYKTLSDKNQIDFEILYPLRGKILDKNDIVIATNKNTYDLFLIPEQISDIEKTLNDLDKYLSIDFKTRRKVISLYKKVKKFQSIKILKNIGWKELEVIKANQIYLPGLDLRMIPQRAYPFNRYYSHILGYTSQPSKEDIQLPFIANMPELDIGRTGLEKILNEKLIGKSGRREFEVNAFGRELREITSIVSNKGENINISLDNRVQSYVHSLLKENKAGSVVVIDINTGQIISMVSIPDFDPNLIIKKPNADYWDKLLNDPLAPLINRSTQGLYAPGSTFKMIVAFAGLKKGLVDLKKNIFCNGKIEYGDRFYHCWKTEGHGNVNLEKAIKESCDCYFYDLAMKIGIDDIANMAKEFGLGKKTSLELQNEKKGIIPNKKWKKDNLKESWFGGETLVSGIGQGYMLTTPLQLVVMTAMIANEGKKIRASVLNSFQEDYESINLPNNFFKIIKKCMNKVVNEERGTAYKSKSNKIDYSGKTGTSQVTKITIEERESEEFRKVEKKWMNKDHALFVGYMPSNNPRYAISIVIEHGGSGATAAAPIAKKVFEFIDNIEI